MRRFYALSTHCVLHCFSAQITFEDLQAFPPPNNQISSLTLLCPSVRPILRRKKKWRAMKYWQRLVLRLLAPQSTLHNARSVPALPVYPLPGAAWCTCSFARLLALLACFLAPHCSTLALLTRSAALTDSLPKSSECVNSVVPYSNCFEPQWLGLTCNSCNEGSSLKRTCSLTSSSARQLRLSAA